MKRLKVTLSLACAAVALLVGGGARAQDYWGGSPMNYSPFALNAWAGIAYDYLSCSGCTLSASNSHFGGSFGGDLGFRFSPGFGIVAIGEYAPIWTGQTDGRDTFSVGGGLRFQPAPATQFLLAGTYSRLEGNGFTRDGWGIKLLGFYPVGYGFGPYLQLAFHEFGAGGLLGSGTVNLFTANAGVSFSL